MAKTLVEELSSLADELRGMHDEFGTRGHSVSTVAIRRYDRDDGTVNAGTVEVVEQITLKPTPRVRGAADLNLQEWGNLPTGTVIVDEVSFYYSVDDLTGAKWANDTDIEFFYEITPKIPADKSAIPQRYILAARPDHSRTTRLGYKLILTPQISERDATGDFPEPY